MKSAEVTCLKTVLAEHYLNIQAIFFFFTKLSIMTLDDIPHSRQVWPRSGVNPALLADFWHGKWYVVQIWARPGIDGTVYVMAWHIWPVNNGGKKSSPKNKMVTKVPQNFLKS